MWPVVLIAVLIFAAPARAADVSSSIDWELRYPLTLFDDLSSRDELKYFGRGVIDNSTWSHWRSLYIDGSCLAHQQTALCSEIKLGQGRLARMRALSRFNSQRNEDLRDAFLGTGLNYHLRFMNDKGHRVSRYYDQKVLGLARTARVKLRLTNAASRSTCEWRVDGVTSQAPCLSWTSATFRKGARGSAVSVRVIETGDSGALSRADTRIVERLIVGFGDSYASGEGNPDIPVSLSRGPNSKPKLDPDPSYPMPERPRSETGANYKRDAAHWLDRDCHRSMLGAQQRAALTYAARRPREETAFLGFACSGAEILEGVIGPYAEVETNMHGRDAPANQTIARHASQLNQAIRTLCRSADWTGFNGGPNGILRRIPQSAINAQSYAAKLEDLYEDGKLEDIILRCDGGFGTKKIDVVLLSIGGNDVRFGGVIADTLADDPFYRLLAAITGSLTSPSKANTIIADPLPAKYDRLDAILRKHLPLSDRARVVIATYPNPLTDASGRDCGAREQTQTRGLEAFWPRTSARITAEESEAIVTKVQEPLNEAIRAAAKRHAPSWIVADTHLDQMIGHGFCAEGRLSREDSLDSRAYFARFNAYARTTRWFRSVNDSFLVQNQERVPDEKRYTLLDTLTLKRLKDSIGDRYLRIYGTIHPNSYGAAALADAYVRALEKALPAQPR